MKRKTNRQPGSPKKRKSLADVILLDMRLLYLSLGYDNCPEPDYKPAPAAANDEAAHKPVDRRVLSDFINQLILDYRMN